MSVADNVGQVLCLAAPNGWSQDSSYTVGVKDVQTRKSLKFFGQQNAIMWKREYPL